MKSTSLFDLSHEKLLSCDMGQLVPIALMDVSPGDTWRQDTSMLVRTQPLLAPIMHKVDIDIHHWFVPTRLVWSEWADFVTGGDSGNLAPVFPTKAVTIAIKDLGDYLGLPTGSYTTSALPFRAYALIFNNWYRDEQLQTPLVVSTASGVDTTTSVALQNGAWGNDYFTKARPSPQLGSAVTIPLTGNAPVIVNAAATTSARMRAAAAGHALLTGGSTTVRYDTVGNNSQLTDNVGTTPAIMDPNGSLVTDLSGVSAVNIDDLRFASALQRYKEKLNIRGSRFTEFLQAMFGVNPEDSRLQLPEYLGGGRAVIQFSEVLQTAPGTDPVGELRGHGISAGKSNRYKYRAKEHGFIISLMCARPKTVYMQGLPKLWNRRSKYEFLLPDFAHLGDQGILNKELYAAHTTPDGIFGYTPKYEEYRTIPNSVAGEFKTTLKFWHMAREFSSSPALNAAFVKSDPTNRVYATTTENQLQIRAIHKIKAKRQLPKVGNPQLY